MNKYVLSIQQTCLIPHVIRKDIIDRKKRISPKPSLSGNPFFQPPCALALLLCAWRLFRALGCGGVGEVDYMGRV